MRLVAHDAQVERLFVEQDSDIRGLRRVTPFERLALRQRPDGRRLRPVRFVEPSVDVDCSGRPLRPCDWRVGADAIGLLGGRRRGKRSDGHEERDEGRAPALEGHLSARFVDADFRSLIAPVRNRQIQARLLRDEQRRARTGGGRDVCDASKVARILFLKYVDKSFATAHV